MTPCVFSVVCYPMDNAINEDDADSLITSGDWLTESGYLDKISRISVGSRDKFADGRVDPSVDDIIRSRDELIEGLRASFEHRIVKSDSGTDPQGLELRIGKGAVYKILPTLREALADFLGLLFAGLTSTKLFTLFAAWAAVSTWKIVKTLIGGFERLSDPVEYAVFEAVFRLQGEISVRDYDALKDNDFDTAYGTIAPITEAVVAKVAGDHPSDEVEAALNALKTREILCERDGRWSIKF